MSVAFQCPQCQAPISANTKKCEYCQSEIFVSSVAYLSTKDSGVISRYLSSYQTLLNENPRNLEANVGVGVCFLIRGLYQEAQPYFVMATNIDLSCSHGYYYRTLCDIAELPYERLDIKIMLEKLKYLKLAYDIDTQPHFAFLIKKIVNKFYLDNYLRVPKIVRDVYNSELDLSTISESELSKINDLIKF